MSRAVPEWIGKTPDTTIPPRVRMRVFTSKVGKCHRCSRKIGAGEPWTCEHLIAIINGGSNRESNLDVTCCFCLPVKNAEDVAEKSRVYRKAAKNIGIDLRSSRKRIQSRGFQPAPKQRSASRPLLKEIGADFNLRTPDRVGSHGETEKTTTELDAHLGGDHQRRGKRDCGGHPSFLNGDSA
jgi:hypothetical protein